jgi:hypothetical protein
LFCFGDSHHSFSAWPARSSFYRLEEDGPIIMRSLIPDGTGMSYQCPLFGN